MKFKFQKLYQCDKKHYFQESPSRQHDWLLSVKHFASKVLQYQLGKQAFVKENEKTSVLKKSVKSLRYTDEFLS